MDILYILMLECQTAARLNTSTCNHLSEPHKHIEQNIVGICLCDI